MRSDIERSKSYSKYIWAGAILVAFVLAVVVLYKIISEVRYWVGEATSLSEQLSGPKEELRKTPPAVVPKPSVPRRPVAPVQPPTTPSKTDERPMPKPPPRVRIVLPPPALVPPPIGENPFPKLSDVAFYQVSRGNFQKWADLPLEQMGVLYKPHYEWGHFKGIQISQLQPESFLRRLKLDEGDILMSINGRNVVSPGQARKIYQDIAKRSRNITIQLRRAGQTHTVDFSLQ